MNRHTNLGPPWLGKLMWGWVLGFALGCMLGAMPSTAHADELDERLHRLSSELRCLVCQNESLADSHAPLAMDLKREIRARMQAGDSDEQLRQFLVERYGDFVTYRPPLNGRTLALWLGPLVMLAGGVWALQRSMGARS